MCESKSLSGGWIGSQPLIARVTPSLARFRKKAALRLLATVHKPWEHQLAGTAMLARRTTTALVGLTVFTNAFQQLPRPALRPMRRRAADDGDDDFDFEAAFKAVH